MRYISISFLCLFALFLGSPAVTWADMSNCQCTDENHCGCKTGGECRCGESKNDCPYSQSTGNKGDFSYSAPSHDLPTYNAPVCNARTYNYVNNDQAPYQYYNNDNADSYANNWDNSYNSYNYYNFYDNCCDNSDCYDGCCDGWENWLNSYYNDMPCPRYIKPIFACDCEPTKPWPCTRTGGWMPERPPLFRPFIADPRQLTYSAGWRFNDQALEKNVIDVSYWDCFPVYGWCNAYKYGDQLQINLEGCLWAVFDPCTFSSPLINADYYVGIHVDYAFKCWSHRIRIFHISSHVGDEFLLNHPNFDRRNPSAEYLDYFASYQWNNDLRIYGGLGWVIEQDESFHTGRFYAEGGVEARISSLGCYDTWNHIYRVPFFAMHFRYRNDFDHHLDATYALGIEVGKTNGLEHRLRAWIEYHDGYSVEGQWSNCPTNYLAIRASYGF